MKPVVDFSVRDKHDIFNFLSVPSENKRDHRTIEEVLAETRAKKKLKTEAQKNVVDCPTEEKPESSNENSNSQTSESLESDSVNI